MAFVAGASAASSIQRGRYQRLPNRCQLADRRRLLQALTQGSPARNPTKVNRFNIVSSDPRATSVVVADEPLMRKPPSGPTTGPAQPRCTTPPSWTVVMSRAWPQASPGPQVRLSWSRSEPADGLRRTPVWAIGSGAWGGRRCPGGRRPGEEVLERAAASSPRRPHRRRTARGRRAIDGMGRSSSPAQRPWPGAGAVGRTVAP